MCRDEMKKINRDKVQLTERLKEAEGAQLRLDGEVHSLKSAAMAANERHDASLAQMEKKLQKAQDSAQSKQEEVHVSVCIVFDKQISKPYSAQLFYVKPCACSCHIGIVSSLCMSTAFPLHMKYFLPVEAHCLKIGLIATEPSQWWHLFGPHLPPCL
jgi:predicted  nucleic acid-binding Zn-ribbon protein